MTDKQDLVCRLYFDCDRLVEFMCCFMFMSCLFFLCLLIIFIEKIIRPTLTTFTFLNIIEVPVPLSPCVCVCVYVDASSVYACPFRVFIIMCL